MTRWIATPLAALAILLGVASPALARQPASGTTKASILKALGPGLSPQCNGVWTTNLRGLGLWALVVTTRDTGACSQEQAGDAAYLHFTRGRWRSLAQGNEASCRNGGFSGVPVKVQADLLNCR
ncbi:MAG: hypothetical protein JO130_18740 [Solirubrobacterales bacterium]|nr:hypothetical protein [Solirubrobacterales bacterium]